MIARENGLEPLLRAIIANRATDPAVLGQRNIDEAVATQKNALSGARDILVEELGENADLLGRLRYVMQKETLITTRVSVGKKDIGAKLSDYFDYSKKRATIAPCFGNLTRLKRRDHDPKHRTSSRGWFAPCDWHCCCRNWNTGRRFERCLAGQLCKLSVEN